MGDYMVNDAREKQGMSRVGEDREVKASTRDDGFGKSEPAPSYSSRVGPLLGIPSHVPPNIVDPLDQPFTRRDFLAWLEVQLAYPSNPQFVLQAMTGKLSQP